MEAVEVNYPVDVSKPKFRVTEECEPAICSSIERCRSSVRRKDATNAGNASQSTSWETIQETGYCGRASHKNSSPNEDLSKQRDCKGLNCLLSDAVAESAQLQRKVTKVPRSSNGCAKRPRIGQETSSSAEVYKTNDVIVHVLEKNETLKQKNGSNGKRGDRRNFKVPLKLKHDSFLKKACSMNCSGGSGGNNFLGSYGLKSDIKDISNLLEDLSLDDLLNGNSKYPKLRQDKEKQVPDTKETFEHLVRRAFSVLPAGKHLRHPRLSDMDSKKTPSGSVSPPIAASFGITNQADISEVTMSSCNKGQCGELEIPTCLSKFPMCQTKDILERLSLPPAKDLETLLQDAAKPSASSRNASDSRSGKQISRRVSLPPFPWSHAYNGHCRTNTDSVKLLANRSTCPGRWMTIKHKLGSPLTSTNCFTDLESVVYDQTLVPSPPDLGTIRNQALVSSEGPPLFERDSSPGTSCPRAVGDLFENGVQSKDQLDAGHCPRLFAAARTLYDIATDPKTVKLSEIVKGPKKSLQKVIKARKSNMVEKPVNGYVAPSSLLDSDMLMVRGLDPIVSSKRPKLCTMERKKDVTDANSIKKGPTTWSSSRFSKSSPGRSIRHIKADVKHNSTCLIKETTSTMHPPAAALGKACSSQHKFRKLMLLD